MLELYDMDNLESPSVDPSKESEINRIIDERLNLHSLVNKVVDGKMMQRDAVQQLLMSKLNEEIAKEKKKNADIAEVRKIQEQSTPQSDEYFRGMTNGLEVANTIVNEKEPEFVEHSKVIPLTSKKSRPLSDFVENRKKKLGKKEFSIEMKKGESFDCPDCGNKIFSDSGFSGCICFGDVGKVYLKKTESGIKVSFPKSWDPENIEMLLEVLRSKKNEKL